MLLSSFHLLLTITMMETEKSAILLTNKYVINNVKIRHKIERFKICETMSDCVILK